MKRVALMASLALLGGTQAAQAPDAHHKRVGHELRRLHLLNARLRQAVGQGVPPALSALARISACEAGGNPRAVSPDGHYRGAWQWDAGTWRSVGGRGDPAAASIEEQWARALLLYIARGTQPWPYCKRFA